MLVRKPFSGLEAMHPFGPERQFVALRRFSPEFDGLLQGW